MTQRLLFTLLSVTFTLMGNQLGVCDGCGRLN